MDLNKKIRELIDAKVENPYGFSSDSIADSVMNYTECSEFEINVADIKVGVEKIYDYIGTNDFHLDRNADLGMDKKYGIITNSVNGRIAKYLNSNIFVYCFDNDYYCSQASQIVNSERNKNNKIEFLFGDISQFFASEFQGNFGADFIVTCPSQYNSVYKELDCEMKYRQMNSYEYYTKRSLEFLSAGGVCLSIVPTTMEDFVVKQLLSHDKPVIILNTVRFVKGYSFIYIKKA